MHSSPFVAVFMAAFLSLSFAAPWYRPRIQRARLADNSGNATDAAERQASFDRSAFINLSKFRHDDDEGVDSASRADGDQAEQNSVVKFKETISVR